MLLSNLDLLATSPGGVARLRELILTLAVQGKLVQQDPADEPASVLLKKIRAERESLIAEGKIKRSKPLPEIADKEVRFAVPRGWEWAKLGDICSYIQRGKGPVYADHSQHRVVSQKCVRWYGLDLAPARFVTTDSLTKYDPIRFLRAGDLLWNSTGTGTIGRACLVPLANNKDGLIADSHVTVVRPMKIDSRFLWRWIQSPYVQDEIEGSASGTTNQIELNTATVVNHLFPLPPLAEQSRIVTRVEELMRLCDALEAKRQLEATQHAQLVSTLLGTLTASTTPEELTENWQRVAQHFDLLLDRPEAIDALEQTLLQLAVRGLLVPQDPTDEPASTLLARIRAEKDRLIVEGKIKRDKPLPPIAKDDQPLGLPTGWEWARLGSIFQVITDGDHLPPPVSEAGIAFLTIGNISSGVLNFDGCRLVPQDYFDDIAEYRRPARGDILYTVVGASYGRAVVVETDRSFCVQRHIGILKPSVQVNLQYLALLLGSQLIYEQATRSLTGTAQPTVGIRSLRNFLAPLPPLAEQSRIVTRITALRRLCGDLRQRLNAAQATQSHLAQALVESSPAL